MKEKKYTELSLYKEDFGFERYTISLPFLPGGLDYIFPKDGKLAPSTLETSVVGEPLSYRPREEIEVITQEIRSMIDTIAPVNESESPLKKGFHSQWLINGVVYHTLSKEDAFAAYYKINEYLAELSNNHKPIDSID